ncbi:MAG: hypothetical protein ABI338_07670, partial [Gemmatimonadaceae bacterium]
MRTRLGHALGVAATVTFATCTTMHRTSDRVSDDPGTMTLTEDQIAQSGASNAWELLRRDVKKYTYAEDQFGRPFSIRSQRGTSSLNLIGADGPMIIID